MYSGTTLKQLRTLDRWFGAHQKIDRLARVQLTHTAPSVVLKDFPSTIEILRFEGMDGPDAIKRKTPAQDEPWHFYDPYNEQDTQILHIISNHYNLLVQAIRTTNRTRASFEAAWIAHAIVDGLTPAHHYPYEQELERIRGGETLTTRTTPTKKLLMPGDTMKQRLQRNWRMWGDKGLLATHIAFEAGVALLILPMRHSSLVLPKKVPSVSGTQPYLQYFQSQARHIANLRLYESFYASGWTPKLSRQIRRELVPAIVSTVSYAWYCACRDATESPARVIGKSATVS